MALKFCVASVFVGLVVAIAIGEIRLVAGAFLALVLSLRLQRRQEARLLHGYRRRRRSKGSRGD